MPPLRGRVEYAEGSRTIGYVPQKETLDALYLFSAHDVALMGGCREIGPGRRLGKEARARASKMLELTGAGEFEKRLGVIPVLTLAPLPDGPQSRKRLLR